MTINGSEMTDRTDMKDSQGEKAIITDETEAEKAVR